jgi:hypothetical protein
MQINNNNKKRQQDIPDEIEEDIEIKRDLELENIAGNLMIAEYQVDKLGQRLSEQVGSGVYHPFGTKKTSAHTFKYNGKWYKVSIKVEELSLDMDNNAVKSQN